MARFSINSDMKAYAKYFGRGVLILLGVLLVAGLIAFSFFYGDRNNGDSAGDTPSVGQTGEAVAGDDGDVTFDVNDGASNNDARADAASNEPPTTSTEAIPNTGPAETGAVAAVVLVFVARKYHQSKQSLRAAESGI